MGVYYVFIVSKSGGLIFDYDNNVPVRKLEDLQLDRYPAQI